MSYQRQLSIIILHFETPQLLEDCLERLELALPNVRKLIIDTSESPSKAASIVAPPNIPIFKLPNIGMAYGINEGLKQTRTPFIAHMNADVLVNPDTFDQLLESLEAPGVGMVGPRFVTANGRWQDQGLLYRRFYARIGRSRQPAIPVPWLSGALQVVKRKALQEVGGMNASLRFYNEDVEWCWRLRQAGYSCLLHGTTVTHLGGSATPDDPKFILEGYRGGLLLSEWYKPRWYRHLHRLGLKGIAAWKTVTGSLQERETYRGVRSLLERDLSTSPFGTSLREANPDFFGEQGRQLQEDSSKA